MPRSSRPYFAAIFVICAALIGFALYLQEEQGLDPCPMCILQRYAFVVIGVLALVAAIHGPRGAALKAYSALLVLVAIAGAGVAARQSWLQHHPPAVSSCGTDLEFLINTFPLSQALPRIFAGSGDCSAIHWRWGLTIPEWCLVWFALIALTALWVALRRSR